MSAVPTTVVRSDLMSAVRRPLASAAAIASRVALVHRLTVTRLRSLTHRRTVGFAAEVPDPGLLKVVVTARRQGTASAAGDAIVVPAGPEFELVNAGAGPLRLLCCLPVGGQARLPDGSTFTPPWAQ